MKKHRLNIKEFSKILGVSTATVSRAFSVKGRISEKTRRLIRTKAETYGYRANIHARNLILQKSDNIAFFYPSLIKGEPDYFISEIMLGVSGETSARKVPLQIYPMSDIYTEYYREIIFNGSISGVIVTAGTKSSATLIKTAKSAGLPYVVIGHMAGEKINTVSFDTSRGAKLAGKYFHDAGRKYPAYVGGILDKRKREGFTEGLGDIGKDTLFDAGGCTFHDGSLAFERIIRQLPKTDCILCANDIIAIGFIRAALSGGVKIPEDIAVIGFDDIRIAGYYTPSLTTVRLHLHAIGEKAVRRLMDMINGNNNAREESVESELIVRESA